MRISGITVYTLATVLLWANTVSSQTTTSTKPATSTLSTATPIFVLPTPSPIFVLPPDNSTHTPAPTSSIGNSTATLCPGPLIPNSRNLDISTCLGPCCIKCPAYKSFYPPNATDDILGVTYVIRQISMACGVFLAISYMVLPGKRSQPHISVLFLMVSLSLWYAAFDVMPGTSNACVDEFEASTWHNSSLCAAQGVLIVYFTQTCVLWCALLIYKLHLLAVWQSDFIDRYYGWLTAFCWIFPLGFAIPLAAKKLSQFPGIGFSCIVSTDHLTLYLFYPLAVYIYPALLFHAFTVAKMIQLAILSSKVDTAMSQMSTNAKMKFTSSMQAKRLLRGQWRPALMLTTTMAAITVFWLFYYVDAHRLSNISTQTIWVQDWLTCVKSSGYAGLTSDEAQTKCAIMIKSNLPSIPWFGAAETLISIIGIIVAVIFVSKVEFWSEWSGVIYGLLGRKKPGTDSESQSPPVATDKSPVLDRSSSYQYNDPNMRKGIRVGYNDELPVHLAPDNKALPGIDALEVPQQYDMDDLLDKEYDLQETDLQRNTSYGSFKAETVSPSSQIPNAEPPRYLATTIQDPYPDDILYPSTAKKIEPWSASSHTIASPSKAYLIANDNSDRYVEQPMVPRPVPRASLKFKNNQQQVQQQLIISASPPQSPTYVQTPLSPMPPKPSNQSSTPFLPRKKEPDSVPIVSGVQGSPAIGYVNPPSAKAKLFDSNESNEKIMVASRESVTGYNNGTIIGRGLSKILSHRQSSDLMGRINPKTKAPAALDLQIETQTPPSIPLKSPARRQNSVSRGQLQQQYQQNESQGSYSQSRSPPTFPLEPSQ